MSQAIGILKEQAWRGEMPRPIKVHFEHRELYQRYVEEGWYEWVSPQHVKPTAKGMEVINETQHSQTG